MEGATLSRRNRTRNRQHITVKSLPPSMAPAYNRPSPTARSVIDVLNTTIPAIATAGVPMPRDPRDINPFGPLEPLIPAPIDQPRRDTGRPEPRVREYEVAWNVPGNDNRPVPWHILRDASNRVDILRRCIEIRKRHLRSLKWSWTVSDDAIAKAYRDDPRFGRDNIEARLRDQWYPEIARMTEFWEKPWKTNGLTFGNWINGVMEEYLVLDAIAIYPQMTYGGDLIDLEILDGTTIKPLLDWRGARPLPPHPAFQQDLYGFPRGEFTATTEIDEDGNEILNGSFTSDQLYYHRENFRPASTYGYSPVEQALVSASLYLKRQGWMLSEYDNGSTPLTWLVPDPGGATELDPRQRRIYEESLNDELSGQTAARHRIKLSFPGFKPEMMPSVDERYKPDYDLYLIKLLASHMGTTIAELGFTESKGLGSSGYHEGQEDVQDRIGRRPDSEFIKELVVDLSRRFLHCPPELDFQLLGLESEDEAAQDQVAQNRVVTGRMVLNEDRQRQGEPLFDFPEADMPMIVTQRGVIFLEGASQLAPPGELVEPVQAPKDTTPPEGAEADPTDGETPTPNPKDTQKAADPTKAVVESDSTRDRVRQQLAEDYPPDSMEWLKTAVWSGPESVPTSDIDYSNEDTWRATHEPEKVNRFMGKIQHGRLKPIILINTPDERKYIVIDGHHRSLAYRKLGIPAMAYIGRVPTKVGPWDEMHASQRDPSGPVTEPDKSGKPVSPIKKLTSVNTPSGALTDAVRQELHAYGRWLKKNPYPKRSFQFTHPEAELLVKTGGGDVYPKASGSAKNWPAWDHDIETAEKLAQRLRTQLTTSIDTARIAQRWLQSRTKAAQPKPDSSDARIWLANTDVPTSLASVLTSTVTDGYTEGYLIGGVSSGSAVTGSPVDWSNWTPGDLDAARLALDENGSGAGLQRMLDNAGVTITSIAGNRMDELAQVLATALANGDSPDTLATTLRGVLDDPSWADMVATTEISRAVSQASLDTYQQNGVQAVEWLTADDDRVCAICGSNEDASPISLNSAFPSGDNAPPAHPRCRCAISPVILTGSDATAVAE